MKSCRDYQELISRLIDGDLSESEQADVRAHVESCPECAALYEAFSSLSGHLSCDLAEPPESLRENVMADVRREKLRAVKHPSRAVWTAAACLAVVLLAAFAAPRYLRMGSSAVTSAPAAQYSMAAGAAEAESAVDYDEASPAEMPAPEPKAPTAESYTARAEQNDLMAADATQAEEAGPLYELDEARSREFLALLQDGEGFPDRDEGGNDPICVRILDGGEARGVNVYADGDSLYFRMDDGSRSGTVECTEAELWTLLG